MKLLKEEMEQQKNEYCSIPGTYYDACLLKLSWTYWIYEEEHNWQIKWTELKRHIEKSFSCISCLKNEVLYCEIKDILYTSVHIVGNFLCLLHRYQVVLESGVLMKGACLWGFTEDLMKICQYSESWSNLQIQYQDYRPAGAGQLYQYSSGILGKECGDLVHFLK